MADQAFPAKGSVHLRVSEREFFSLLPHSKDQFFPNSMGGLGKFGKYTFAIHPFEKSWILHSNDSIMFNAENARENLDSHFAWLDLTKGSW